MAVDVRPTDTNFADAGLRDLRLKNPVYRKMAELRQRSVEVIAGRTRLLLGYGPPGIGKSIAVYQMLDVHHHRLKQRWEEQTVKDERRTIEDENGEQAFRAPFSVIQGGTSFPVFFCHMFWASCPREVLLIDDVSSVRNKLIQAALQQATDPTTNGTCYYNYRTKLPDDLVPKRYQFRGGIIILTNFRKSDGSKEFRQIFSDAVLDRSTEVEFPFELAALVEFVVQEAFTNRGLLKYLTAPADPDLPTSQQGLGFTGDDRQAEVMLNEVRDYFVDKINRVQQVSFRTVQKLLKDRYLYPRDWQRLAESSLLRPLPKHPNSRNRK